MAVCRDEIIVECNHYTGCTRGYHDYMDVWTTTTGEILYLHCEPDNPKAVAIVTGEDMIVGHTPELFNRQLLYFLQRDHGHNGCCEVTSEKVNRGIGVGLKIPCKYCFRGKNIHVKKRSSI